MADLEPPSPRWCCCSAPTKSTSRRSRARSRSISATTATRARAAADIILPGAAYTEKHGTYVNTEGRVQLPKGGVPARRRARGLDDPARAGRRCSASRSPFDSFDELRAAMVADHPELGVEGLVDLRGRRPSSTRKAEGTGRLSDPGLLPDQRRSPAARRCSAARPSCSTADLAEAAE